MYSVQIYLLGLSLDDIITFITAIRNNDFEIVLIIFLFILFVFFRPPTRYRSQENSQGIIYFNIIDFLDTFFPSNSSLIDFLNKISKKSYTISDYYYLSFWFLVLFCITSIITIIFYNILFCWRKYIILILVILSSFLLCRFKRNKYVKLMFKITPLILIVVLFLITNNNINFENKKYSFKDFDDSFFSYPAKENILIRQEYWFGNSSINISNDEQLTKNNWKETCKINWDKKESKKFDEFISECPKDIESKIYVNNAKVKTQNNLFVIAVAIPISGDDGYRVFDCIEILRGVEKAQREINEKGILLNNGEKFYLQVAIIDDGYNKDIESKNTSKQDEAKKAAIFLAENKNIVGVVGHFSSDATEAAAEIYKKKSLVVISPTSTAVRNTNNKFKFDGLKLNEYIFRTSPNDFVATKKLISHIRQYNKHTDRIPIKKIAIIYEKNNRYGKLYKKIFKINLQNDSDLNLNIINDLILDDCGLIISDSNPEDCLKCKGKQANALLLVPSTQNSEYIEKVFTHLKELKEKKYANIPKLFGGDSMFDERYTEPFYIEKGSKEMVVAVPIETFENDNFQANWRTSMAYDATQVFVEGIKNVLDENKNSISDNQTLREKLKENISSENFNAVGFNDKEISFDENGDRKQELAKTLCIGKRENSVRYEFIETRNGEC